MYHSQLCYLNSLSEERFSAYPKDDSDMPALEAACKVSGTRSGSTLGCPFTCFEYKN
jgi:hypothetical protein